MATFKIRAAVITPPSQLAPDLPRTVETSAHSLTLCTAAPDELTTRSQDAIYSLYSKNMDSILEGTSAAYTEASKREELFDSSTRFILLLRPNPSSPLSDSIPMPGALPRPKQKGKMMAKKDFDEAGLMGYCSFRFDTEETLGSRDVEVVYCYELQLSDPSRGQGLGKTLMDVMEKIGKERGMYKSMLTCMKSATRGRYKQILIIDNEHALRFYTKQGYQPDEIDPTRMAEEESEEEEEGWQRVESDGAVSDEDEPVDYVILSKNLNLVE